MIGAVLSVLGGRGVAIIGGVAAALALLVAVYQAGVNAERTRGQAASLRAELAIAKADLDNSRKAEADAIERARFLADADDRNRKVLDELENDLRRRPAVGRCALDSDDHRRLLRIR